MPIDIAWPLYIIFVFNLNNHTPIIKLENYPLVYTRTTAVKLVSIPTCLSRLRG